MAFGVVGMFDVALDIAVRSMWDELESRFGLGGVRAVPWPHVSFVVAGGWDRDAVERAISTNLPSMSATPVHLEPWVLFTGTSPMHPAIVRAAVRSRSIDRLHGAIAEVVPPLVQDPSPFTSTDRWNPHVTVATRDLTSQSAGDVMAWFAETNLSPWVGTITRLACIEADVDQHRIVAEYELRA